MPLRVACQMDPIDRIDIGGDSTFALLLEAQGRGHSLFYYTPPSLALDQGRLLAKGSTLFVEDKPGDHYKLSDPRTVDLSTLDVVLLRQDPPFDMAYITTTWSASIPRPWWSTTPPTCATRPRRCSSWTSST
jgi:glutathione synthase